MGIAVLIVLGLALVGLALATAIAPRSARTGVRYEADPWFTLGISLAGVGTALMATIGPGMIGIVAFGIFLIGWGARRMRNSSGRGMR